MRAIHHICIQTNKYEESLKFYKEILGFEIIKETKNFHNRDFNTWLQLGSFMIELQTGKINEKLNKYNRQSEGIVHFCIYTDSIQDEYNRLKKMGFSNFLSKNGEDIYNVENGYLFKITAPEGTIVEIRDTEGI
ncbi:MAG: VOC family protein [Bacillota bacterium]|nr:VOC family protein [Bacillota bacterium]